MRNCSRSTSIMVVAALSWMTGTVWGQTAPDTLPTAEELGYDVVSEEDPSTLRAEPSPEPMSPRMEEIDPGETSEGTGAPADAESSEPAGGIEALGYEIVTGPDMGQLQILQHGSEVWSIQTYMVSYEPPREREGGGVFELLVDTRENRRSGTLYLLELGPDGVRVLSETAGPPSGIQAPGESVRPDPEYR